MNVLESIPRFFLEVFRAIVYAGADGWWIMAVGSLVAAGCSVIGCFLVLRKISMLGDAISHAVLPGIVIAFLFTSSRSIFPMVIGAGLVGLLTTFITDVLNRQGKLQSDASIGVTFTSLFAVGVILVSKYASQVDLDLDCVLFGEILYAPFDTVAWGGMNVPRSALVLAPVVAADIAFVVLAWKQLKICSFDPELAAAMGVRVALWHYLLMACVSITTVASFESVGAILVVAMLIVPPNTAYLLTDHLWRMVVLAAGFGVSSALIGYGVATALDGSIAGAMAVVSGAQFALAALFGPRYGVVPKAWRLRHLPLSPDADKPI
ncbi:MAG: membrane protein [Candidatus Hydrogenedentota bacterium]